MSICVKFVSICAKKMKTLEFSKVVASGNDFILIDCRKNAARFNFTQLAQKLCHRTMGIGADGLLVLEKSKKVDVRMRILNADGSEAEMCGNGARCSAFFVSGGKKNSVTIDTKAGIIKASVRRDTVTIGMTRPSNIKLNFPLLVNQHSLSANFINTGVPHAVIFCDDVSGIDVFKLGRLIRYHRRFSPAGTNVNFVEPRQLNLIRARTYERGVEKETFACGTGSVASAIVYAMKLRAAGLVRENNFIIFVDTASGERLSVRFSLKGNNVVEVFLEGKATIICRGVCYV